MQDECLLYPIFDRDLENKTEDIACFPIYASEIVRENTSVSNENPVIIQQDNRQAVRAPANAEKKHEITAEIPECVDKWVKEFVERLSKDHITVEEGVEVAMAQLFMHAIDSGEVVEGTQSEEYVKDIALNMEFQIMLKGSGEDNVVTKTDAEQLTRDLFGEAIETQSLIKEKKKVNVVASVTGKNREDSLRDSISVEPILEQTRQQNDTSYEKNDKTESKKTAVVKDINASTVQSGLSVLDALKLNGKYPTKKDEQKKVVPDMFCIDKATKRISDGENVLFACFSWIAYCSKEKVKTTKKLTMKLPFLDNTLRVFVITDSAMVLSSTYATEKEAIVISLKEVVGVNHVFEKKLGSVGQTQILLSNGNIIVITIDKVIGVASDQKQFDEFKEKIDNLLGLSPNEISDIDAEGKKNTIDDGFETGIRRRKSSLEKFKEMLLEPEQYPNPSISMIDRLVAVVLVEKIIDLFDKYFSSDEKDSTLLMIQESCINRKLNELLQDDMFGVIDISDFGADSELPQEALEAITSVDKEYSDYLDELMKDARAHYTKVLKNA